MPFGALNSGIFTITYIQPQKALNESILNPTQISSTVTIKYSGIDYFFASNTCYCVLRLF